MGDQGFALHGLDLFGNPVDPRANLGPLAQRFEWPPFSVLSAREGDWQDRKRAWVALGIEGEVGREAGASFGAGVGGEKSIVKGVQGHITAGTSPDMRARFEAAGVGASIFDPVLCQLVYQWFCPPGGLVLDPFAGGSVRGIVAGLLGYRYRGIELRFEQVQANRVQREAIAARAPAPWLEDAVTWACGDTRVEMAEWDEEADLVFTCPPYGDLERYSDDPRDLSTLPYGAFLEAYQQVAALAERRLKPDRFCCYVVGDFRDRKTGYYRGFVADTIKAFQAVGMGFYNDAVLVTPTGTLPVRVGAQFQAARKLGKTHQNVLVFVKGDPKAAVAAWEAK